MEAKCGKASIGCSIVGIFFYAMGLLLLRITKPSHDMDVWVLFVVFAHILSSLGLFLGLVGILSPPRIYGFIGIFLNALVLSPLVLYIVLTSLGWTPPT